VAVIVFEALNEGRKILAFIRYRILDHSPEPGIEKHSHITRSHREGDLL
jgi:hypothetical protein